MVLLDNTTQYCCTNEFDMDGLFFRMYAHASVHACNIALSGEFYRNASIVSSIDYG